MIYSFYFIVKSDFNTSVKHEAQYPSSDAITLRTFEKYVRPRRVSIHLSLDATISPLTDLLRETERDWDKDLAEDVKGECEEKYGPVEAIKVEKETQVP